VPPLPDQTELPVQDDVGRLTGIEHWLGSGMGSLRLR
jgi:hypothetical protein